MFKTKQEILIEALLHYGFREINEANKLLELKNAKEIIEYYSPDNAPNHWRIFVK